MTDFEQPTLDNGGAPAPSGMPKTAVVVPANNSGKTDALSLAVAAQRKVIVAEPEKELPPGPYQLDYVYNGEAIHETHRTIPHALARVAALKRLGIVPATSVAESA